MAFSPTPNQLSHFAINCDDLARAQGFYQSVFHWQLTPFAPDFLQISTEPSSESPTVRGALQKRRELVPGQPVALECTFAVKDIDAAIAAIEAAGGKIVMPKAGIPGVGTLVFFQDTEGNIAGAMQYDLHE